MSDRDSGIVLALGFCVAVVVHVVVLAAAQQHGLGHGPPQRDERPAGARPPILEARPELGRDRPAPARVAWIAHDDYRELLARQSVTEQPALQDEVEPTDEAPIEIEPTPPAAEAEADVETEPVEAQAPPAEAAEAVVVEAEVPSTDPDDPRDGLILTEIEALPGPPITLAEESPGGFVLPVELLALEEEQASPIELPDSPGIAAPAPDPAALAGGDWVRRWLLRLGEDRPRPTAAPRAEHAVDPVRLDESDLRRVGGKLVGEGIEITTARLRLGVASGLTASPRNTRVEITFRAGEGTVTNAKLLGSTGYRDWDAAVRSSLYGWRASGSRVDESEADIVLEWEYRFH